MAALKNTLRIIVFLAFALLPAQAEIDSHHVDEELIAAGKSVNEGHVKAGYERLLALLRQIDPAKDKDYWRISATLVEFLSQIEDHPQAAQLLNSIIATKIPETQPAYRQWMQFYIGRNLAYSGKADEGEKFLRALTAGDARHSFKIRPSAPLPSCFQKLNLTEAISVKQQFGYAAPLSERWLTMAQVQKRSCMSLQNTHTI